MLCTCTKFFVLNDFVYVQLVIKVDVDVTKLYRAHNNIHFHDSFFFLLVLNGS